MSSRFKRYPALYIELNCQQLLGYNSDIMLLIYETERHIFECCMPLIHRIPFSYELLGVYPNAR